MKNPSQALAWSAYSLSWPALLAQIAGAVSVIFLIILSLDPEVDSAEPIHVADIVLLGSLVFLYSVMLHRKQKAGRATAALGFPYTTEFSLPVSTHVLILVPLLSFCLLTQIAVFVPGMIVNLSILDVEVSIFPISFIVFQYTIIPLMLTWWTQNGLAGIAGWLIAIALYMSGLLIPEFTRPHNSWVLIAESSSAYITSLLFTAGLLLLTYIGVAQQRSGEVIFNFGNGGSVIGDTQQLRNWMPLPAMRCPTASPIRAEIWKERQLHGEYNALFGGITAVAATFAIITIIQFFVPGANIPTFTNVLFLALGMYVAVCTSLIISLYGVRYRNGLASVSVSDKTTPLSTAQLTVIRSSVTLGSALLAGLVMAASIWALGPFLINDFAEMRTSILENFQSMFVSGIAGAALRITLVLISFLTGLILYATFLTWFMLQSRKMSIGISVIPAYIFLVVIFLLMFLGDRDDFYLIQDAVFQKHLWVIVFLIPAGIIFLSQSLLRVGVLSTQELIWVLALGVLVQVLNLIWLFGPNNYNVMELGLSITKISYLVMQGFLPLLAVTLALWTSDRIRHG